MIIVGEILPRFGNVVGSGRDQRWWCGIGRGEELLPRGERGRVGEGRSSAKLQVFKAVNGGLRD